jgi:ADP-ribosylglycohydrolase
MKNLLLLFAFFILACKKEEQTPSFTNAKVNHLNLSEKELHQKILGMLVGSAYGDAMGAPTEMWSREAIKLEYGYVEKLDSMVREASPEGIWKPNLPAGGSTDDTRWKQLVIQYLLKQKTRTLQPKDFTKAILIQYNESIENYAKIKSYNPEPFEENTLRVAWLQEWAKVASPFVRGEMEEFQNAFSKFYGGEMVCAGLLYAPAVGAFYPEEPQRAYQEMFKLSMFDIGFAKDISSLSAAMTAAAMKKNATKDQVLAVLRDVDPENFFKSRLVGRTSFKLLKNALYINSEAKKEGLYSEKRAFELLDQYQQDMPFHAAEIYIQVLTAMICSDFDFQKTMQFLVNYGRDNDTTAAVAGGIIGAMVGYDLLPDDKYKVIKTTKEKLNIDLEVLASQMTKHVMEIR